MKFIVSQSDFSSAIAFVSKAVPSRPTHPVLGNILVVVEDGKVSLTGFDLSLGIQTSFVAETAETGTVTIPAKLLGEIVSKLPNGELTIALEEKDEDSDSLLITITSASGRFQIRGLTADEFPELPSIEDGESLELPIASIVDGIKGTIFAASTDETKQVLTGIHLTGSESSLEFAATDGHRLAAVTVELEDELSVDEFAATIPAKALKEVERMLSSDDSETVSILVDDKHAVFQCGSNRITTRKLDGGYPTYNQLIPRQFSRTVTMERKRLLSGIDIVSVLADQKSNLVKCALDATECTLLVEAQDIGNAKEVFPVSLSGEPITVAFNIKYLVDGLRCLPSTEILMQLNEPNQPIIFSPLGGVKMTYLVMPVQIVR